MAGTIILIEWLDANYQHGELDEDELCPLTRFTTVGLLIKEDATSVSLAMEWRVSDNDPNKLTYRHVTHIPKSCIDLRKVVCSEILKSVTQES